MANQKATIAVVLTTGSIIILSYFVSSYHLHELRQVPAVESMQWCTLQPCYECCGIKINQPSSSVFVLILSLLTLGISFHFFRSSKVENSRYWWGLALLMTGIGAGMAGISFQAFGYMIKCSGREFCTLSSWWELGYNILTVAGAGALQYAVSLTFGSAGCQKMSKIYGVLSTFIYSIICLCGSYRPDAFLISFDLMIAFTSPSFIFIFFYHFYIFTFKKQEDLLPWMKCWGILLTTILMYKLYDVSNITEKLWEKGIWFSENDVLHLMMIVWCIYVYRGLSVHVKDKKIIV
jgi:hypothetical protein